MFHNRSLINGTFLIHIYDIIQNCIIKIVSFLWKLWKFRENFTEILRTFFLNFEKFLWKLRQIFGNLKKSSYKFWKLNLWKVLRIFCWRKFCRKGVVKILGYFCGNYKNFMWKLWGRYAVLLRKFYGNFLEILAKILQIFCGNFVEN